ncbi:hypothetical protein F5141DRAFT_1068084 [Pisolithus sp. B1]|nr:hypothetical protein F5141DRAFT_1068084 [Pisolithus sp. B1]
MSVLSSSLSLALSLSLYELCINFTDSEVKASMRKATGRGLSSNASLDYRDNDQDAVGLPPLDEDDNNNQLKDTPLVYSNAENQEYKPHVNMVQKADKSTNVALLCVGLLGYSPSQPHIVISQLSAAFDIYALGCDGPAWKLCGACPACAFEQPDEPPLKPAWLHSMDGNQSAKHLDGLGSTDSCLFHSNYFIPHAEVERFKDNVQDRQARFPGRSRLLLALTTGPL